MTIIFMRIKRLTTTTLRLTKELTYFKKRTLKYNEIKLFKLVLKQSRSLHNNCDLNLIRTVGVVLK